MFRTTIVLSLVIEHEVPFDQHSVVNGIIENIDANSGCDAGYVHVSEEDAIPLFIVSATEVRS